MSMPCPQEFHGQGPSPSIACLRCGERKRGQGVAIRLNSGKGPVLEVAGMSLTSFVYFTWSKW